MMRRGGWILAAAVAVSGSAMAAEPPAVVSARAAGVIGERFDGYLGYAASPSEAVRRQVETINIRRRSLYISLAGRRGVAAQEVGVTAGCQLLSLVPPGGAYLLPDGRWRRRAGTEKITPDYCG